MAGVRLLLDTDIFIDYFNDGFLKSILEGKHYAVHYSVVTKKELLSKPGLKDAERRAILFTLKGCRMISLDHRVAVRFSELRRRYPSIDKEDALIAATALVWGLPLMTRNWKHYRFIEGLVLLRGAGGP